MGGTLGEKRPGGALERDITPQLTAAEVGFLWSHYMGNSLNLGAMKVFLAKVEDKETEMVLRYGYEAALKIANRWLEEPPGAPDRAALTLAKR